MLYLSDTLVTYIFPGQLQLGKVQLPSMNIVALVVAGFGSRPSQLGQGSPSEAHLSLSRQGSLCNHIAELRAQLAYGEAQEPNSSALPNASGAV